MILIIIRIIVNVNIIFALMRKFLFTVLKMCDIIRVIKLVVNAFSVKGTSYDHW